MYKIKLNVNMVNDIPGDISSFEVLLPRLI